MMEMYFIFLFNANIEYFEECEFQYVYKKKYLHNVNAKLQLMGCKMFLYN